MTIIYDLKKLPNETRELIENTPKYAKLFSKMPRNLLSFAQDAKTIKGMKYGNLTGVQYFTPSNGSGVNVCALAQLAQCAKPCLYTAGRGKMHNVMLARLRKTLFFLQYREEYKALLIREIKRLIRKAGKLGMIPMVRLNGTSDIRWEVEFPELFAMFPELQFYDYTKLINRHVSNFPNYDLTFSYSGVARFQPFVKKAIATGMRIAVVFRDRQAIPSKFMGLYCIDGDDSDLRPYDPTGVVVALYAKGSAKHDTSGFVVD